jgi:hypothetical protein
MKYTVAWVVLVFGAAACTTGGSSGARPGASHAAAPASVDLTSALVEALRLSDQYRQCLVLDRTRQEPRDTFFAEFGTSAENLDLQLSDRWDLLLKHLIQFGRKDELLDALRSVTYDVVDATRCEDFDPYYGPALEKLINLEGMVGLEPPSNPTRSRPQHSSR